MSNMSTFGQNMKERFALRAKSTYIQTDGSGYKLFVTIVLELPDCQLQIFFSKLTFAKKYFGNNIRLSKSLRCDLEQNTFILAYYWFNLGRPVPT